MTSFVTTCGTSRCARRRLRSFARAYTKRIREEKTRSAAGGIVAAAAANLSREREARARNLSISANEECISLLDVDECVALELGDVSR